MIQNTLTNLCAICNDENEIVRFAMVDNSTLPDNYHLIDPSQTNKVKVGWKWNGLVFDDPTISVFIKVTHINDELREFKAREIIKKDDPLIVKIEVHDIDGNLIPFTNVEPLVMPITGTNGFSLGVLFTDGKATITTQFGNSGEYDLFSSEMNRHDDTGYFFDVKDVHFSVFE